MVQPLWERPCAANGARSAPTMLTIFRCVFAWAFPCGEGPGFLLLGPVI
jgi:hypothetical protein